MTKFFSLGVREFFQKSNRSPIEVRAISDKTDIELSLLGQNRRHDD
jgi:hypothetical protein